MNRANKIKLGFFVLTSSALLLGGFLAVGITHLFEPKVEAMTIVNTSVEGLNAGSSVKYLGLPIGKVTRIAVRKSDGYIAVYFDLMASAMDSAMRKANEFGSADNLAEMLAQRGASCFVNASSIMGGCFLELTLGFTASPALPNLTNIPTDRMYIPSQPSHIGNAIQNMSRLIEELNRVDVIMLAGKLERALDRMNDVFGQENLMKTLRELNEITSEIHASIPQVRHLLDEENVKRVNQSIANIEHATANIEKITSDSGLAALLDNLDGCLTDLRSFLRDSRQLGNRLENRTEAGLDRLSRTLVRLDNTARAVSEALDRLEDDPSQIVRGRQEE